MPDKKKESRNLLQGVNPAATPTDIAGSLKAMKEDASEQLLRYLSGKLNFRDRTKDLRDDMYLKQFTHPDKDILPRTDVRPQSLSNVDPKLAWRAFDSDYVVPGPGDDTSLIESRPNNIFDTTGTVKRTIADKKPRKIPYPITLPNTGSSTQSVGIDSSTNTPYLSIFDKYDFGKSADIKTVHPEWGETLGGLADKFLGKPFYLYERGDLAQYPQDERSYDVKMRGAERNLLKKNSK